MSEELRFDGRVAIVTGAGGNPSLGRSYAMLLAERGARVVVNDLGTGPDGRSTRPAHAQAVADEIVAAGGEAIADTGSVAGDESAAAIVQTALDAWGRVDVVVNNAGVAILASFDEISASDIQKSIDVHLLGTIWMCRAAWPHMQAAGYGRIVNVASRAALGGKYLSIYGAAKAGILGLTRSLAIEGAEHGILVNVVAPGAQTAAIEHNTSGAGTEKVDRSRHNPERPAAVVAYLAHEHCSATGKFIRSAGGRSAEIYFSETQDWVDPEITVESVRDNFAQLVDRTDAIEIPDPVELAETRGASFVPRPYTPI